FKWYVEFLGHQEQHLEFIDAAAAHMSAYDDNPRAQARAILRMDGADLRTRNEEELATLSSKCLTTWTRAIIRGIKGGTGFKAGNAERRGCGDGRLRGHCSYAGVNVQVADLLRPHICKPQHQTWRKGSHGPSAQGRSIRAPWT
ncbi:MAG: hypothetical protein ACPIOQ_28970, partial [Promethearchaeia archaeon]